MQNMGINQLANMFMGNPQPLQQKVQQAQQQAKPGQIPPDLEAAIALQKIQEMRNAAQNQQAMQAGGPQPTVVDQLKQAIAPQAAPQGLPQGVTQGLPQGMPQGMPQGGPQTQQPMPQQARPGLPQLPSDLGQHLAGGGIIAFNGEDESYVSDTGDYYAQPLSAEARSNMGTGIAKKIAEFMSRNLERDANGEIVRDPETGQPVRKTAPEAARPSVAEVNYDHEGRRQAVPASQGLATQAQPPINPVVAPRPPARIAAPSVPAQLAELVNPAAPAAKEVPSEVETYLRKRFGADKEEAGRLAGANFEKEVGPEDLSSYDRAVQELKRRQGQFAKPETGMPALMEYLQQIALAPKGVGSLTAGAMGAQKVAEMQKERDQQQFDLAKQILEQEQKKTDVQRAYKKELFGVKGAAVKEAGKEAYDAAITLHKSEDEAKKWQKEAEQKALDRANYITLEKMRDARHGAPTFADSQQEAMIKDYMVKHPEASRLDAMTEIYTAKQGATPELRRAALVERLSEAWGKKSMIDKQALANKGIGEEEWIKQQMKLTGIDKGSVDNSSSSGNTMTMADVQATAASSGKTVAEVMAAAKAKGIAVK